MTIGKHTIKPWSVTQAVVALSSGEAELYAMVKGAAATLGLISLCSDFGRSMDGTVHSDSSAAIGISSRQGLGKVRHLNVQYLWIQDRLKRGDVGIKKVLGTENPSDIFTKNLDAVAMRKCFVKLGFEASTDRAITAP